MGKIKTPLPVKLIMGVITSDMAIWDNLKRILKEKWGEIDLESPCFAFSSFTDYYEPEMGKELWRKFYSFNHLISPSSLVEVKLLTQELEELFKDKCNNRRVNLDPGYIEESKLVLATTKNHQHRIYLGQGIYGEVTLRFKRGKFLPWEWTYPDYRTEEYIKFFTEVRVIYRRQLGRRRI